MSVSCNDTTIAEDTLRELLLEYRRVNWKNIQTPAAQKQIVEDLVRNDHRALFDLLVPYVKLTPASRILDLGSGVGGFVVACRERGFPAVGIEPDRIGKGSELTSIEIARRRVSSPVFANGLGEALPFADATFDLVTMNQVIEHVNDQSAVMREAARVVRPGGVIYVACPNYLRCYEPHYKIFWLPLLPKTVGGTYLHLRGRSPVLLGQLTYTTNRRLGKLCAALGPEYTVLDLHREAFLKKSQSGSFAAPSTRLANHLTRLPLLGHLILRAILKYGSIREGGCAMVIVRNPKKAGC